MTEFLAKLVGATVLAVLIEVVDAIATGFSLPWWVSALIGLVLVFGGVLILSEGDWS